MLVLKHSDLVFMVCEGWFHYSGINAWNHLPRPAACTSFDAYSFFDPPPTALLHVIPPNFHDPMALQPGHGGKSDPRKSGGPVNVH